MEGSGFYPEEEEKQEAKDSLVGDLGSPMLEESKDPYAGSTQIMTAADQEE